ncbi:PIF1-like helicase domain-containing protein [Ditylenchus destructor]|uniref:PIF1-like helicase domain-containing protein n=1 Tax=Ditylenchus destructor TaxID=166010 RepID=A0AAD4N677_9BILA|nr:PIF1-like helicase domain-containing protein [Ditylenchus destructor]
MPPKQSKPQVPMETRSRAKAKKNAESQHPVDAKRSRTDSRQAADEDDAPRREKTSDCYKSKVDYFSRLLPRSDAVLNKIALNNSEMLQSIDIYSETAVDSHNDHSEMSNSQLAFGCENDFLNLDTDFTVNNAVELLNEMYNKWLETNSRSSTADTSIKAFISHCNFNDPEVFETLSSNAGVDCDALIAAFENGTNFNEVVSNNDPSNEFACVVSTDEINNASGNNDNTANTICIFYFEVVNLPMAVALMNLMHLKRPSFKLTQNQRVNPEEVEFVETLQKLGDGQMQDGDEGHFEFPTECLTDNVINDVYGTALATKNYDALHERVILTPLNKDANDICDEEMLSLLNKRALSSSLAGFAELAVGTAWTSLLGKFASPELLLLCPLYDANAPAHFLAIYIRLTVANKNLFFLFMDNSSLALQHLLLWLGSTASNLSYFAPVYFIVLFMFAFVNKLFKM